jgi:hypothetical protein
MKRHRYRSLTGLLLSGALFGTVALAGEAGSATAAAPEADARLWSKDDGWLDISGFIDQSYGFIPVVIPITEPAVGLGGAAALVFIDKQKGGDGPGAGFGRPNISAFGVLGTDNGTQGAFAGDMRHWRDDRLKTLVGVVKASVNLEFYGIGRDPLLENDARTFNLDTTAGIIQGSYRLGESQTWASLGYALASTTVGFDILPPSESLPDFQAESRVGGLLTSIGFDSRDNIFTPIRGTYLDASAGLFSEALGSDTDFQRLSLTAIHYRPLAEDLTLGVMGASVLSFGDVPFYLRPFIGLRGAPVMRYQGDYTAEIEAELRWQFWKRFSLIGFAGVGATWNETRNSTAAQDVATAGLGFRYEIARKYGLHMGLDVAYGPEGPAYYVQFGSAWMRP